VFEVIAVLASLAVGFVFGRIWEIRQEIRRDVRRKSQRLDDAGFRIPTAHLPIL
jgi:hypothetical protein